MSTRDEILAALTDHPGGLTSKEIAALCPSCERDEQIVGGLVATLKREGVIYPNGFKNAQLVYFFGAPPREEPVNEPRLPEPITLSEGARALAELRRRNGAVYGATEVTMTKPTVIERCMQALKEHGPCTLAELATHTGSTAKSLGTMTHMLKARGVWKHQANGRKPALFGLPGQKMTRTDIPAFHEQKPDALARGAELGKVTPSEQGHGPAAQSGSRNGNGSAETAAAGPDYSSLLEALQFERLVLKTKVEKLDRAIEALEALA